MVYPDDLDATSKLFLKNIENVINKDNLYYFKAFEDFILILRSCKYLDPKMWHMNAKLTIVGYLNKFNSNKPNIYPYKIGDIILVDIYCDSIIESYSFPSEITIPTDDPSYYSVVPNTFDNDYETLEYCKTHIFKDPLCAFYCKLNTKKIIKGKYISFYINGHKKEEYNYVNGKINGKYMRYYQNNEIEIECYYLNGEYHGKYIEYYEHDYMKYIECNYVNGKLDGHYTKWYDDYIDIECDYVNGQLHGNYFKYDINYYNYYLKIKCNYYNGKKNGKYIEKYENGKTKIKCYYFDDNLDGKYIEYHKDGKLKLTCNYSYTY